ncbi:hypothetical protein Tco_1019009 [Tanacetum coccineum]|uniref:Uncharacterized protein n=1 Tax=Tanacetum coccineum TaxID=301880 RepID=A0ABQ5FWF5_9ASTR
MQAKIFKEYSLNKLNTLKSTTQLLDRQSILYQQAFAQLFGDSVRTFKFQLSQHMNNLETLLNAETLHEMDSKSALSVIKVQFERFINSDLLKPLDIYSRSFSSDREVRENFRDYTKMTAQTFKETIIQNMNSIEQCIIERASHEQELKMTLKKLSERHGIVSDEEIEKKELEAHYGFMAKIQEVLPAESSSTDTPLEQVQNNDEKNVFANERQHSEKHAAECADERAALANLIANLTLDTEENKTILKQLKKANASLTQELEKCKTNLDETNSALGEAISCRDSCLIALQTKQLSLISTTTPLMTETFESSNARQEHLAISELKKPSETASGKVSSFQWSKSTQNGPNADALYNEKQENLRVWFAEITDIKKPVPECSGLVLHQMTSDHNRSELGIHDHSNEPSSSKLVPKVFLKQTRWGGQLHQRQEFCGITIPLHIEMLSTQVQYASTSQGQKDIMLVPSGFAEIVDFLRGSNLRYALTTNPTIYDSLVKQFWQTATANTLADGTLELHATIDTIVYIITEASIRNKLQLADASGITMLPNNEIFKGMGA